MEHCTLRGLMFSRASGNPISLNRPYTILQRGLVWLAESRQSLTAPTEFASSRRPNRHGLMRNRYLDLLVTACPYATTSLSVGSQCDASALQGGICDIVCICLSTVRLPVGCPSLRDRRTLAAWRSLLHVLDESQHKRHNADWLFLALTRALNHIHYSPLAARDKCPLTLNSHPSSSLPELRLIHVTCSPILPKIQHPAGHLELPKSVICSRAQIHWVHQRAGPRHLRLSHKR